MRMVFSIRQGSPTGTQVGPSVTAREMSSNEFPNVKVGWGMEDVPVTPGGTYAVRVEPLDGLGFNMYATNNNNYPSGMLYTAGTAVPGRDMIAVVVGAWRSGGGPGATPTPTSPVATPTPTQSPSMGQNLDFELWNTDKDAVGWIEIDTDHIDRGQSEIAYGDNPLVPGSPENVRVGAGWHVYDCALVQAISVSPSTQYRLRAYGRVLHGTDTVNMWTGVNFENQVMEMGYDLTGQTSNQNAGTVVYTDMTTSGNNVWAMYETTFAASGPMVSIWAHASQPTAEVGLCHFDDFSVQAISQPATSTPTATEPPPVPTPTITVTPIEPQTGLDGRWKAY